MASFSSIAAVGRSVERVISLALGNANIGGQGARKPLARLVRTEDFAQAIQSTPFVSIFLYRVDFNHTMRAAWSAVGAADGRSHLPLDMHFLLTAWADGPELEYQLLGCAMQALEDTPILGGPMLSPDGWAAGESIQVVLDDMSTDTVMRIFDSLQANYKLSVPYIARVVRVDGVRLTKEKTTVTVRQEIAPRTTL